MDMDAILKLFGGVFIDPTIPDFSKETQLGLRASFNIVLLDDKAEHEVLCQQFFMFINANPRPTKEGKTEFKLVVLLPEDSTVPQFMWVKCFIEKTDTATARKCKVHRYQFSPTPHEIIKSPIEPPGNEDRNLLLNMREIFYHGKTNAHLDHKITLWFREEFLADGSRPNKYALGCLRGKKKRDWRGPILVSANIETESLGHAYLYQDVVPSDLQLVRHYIMNNGEFVGESYLDEFENGVAESRLPEIVTGVRVSCQKQNSAGHLAYSNIKMERGLARLICGGRSRTTMLMEIPLYLMNTPIFKDKVKQSAAEVGCGMAENHVPWVLLRSTDIEVGDFWNQVEDDKIVTFSAGSIIAFRKDGKQLTARHLEAVVAYHLEVIIPKMTDLSESAWKERNKDKGKCDTEKLEEARKEMLANFVCKASFEKFFQEYKQKKIESGDAEWAKAVSPYEV